MHDAPRPSRKPFDGRLYLGASLIFATAVLLAFARSYFFKGFFDAPELSTLVHVHAVVMSGWVVLLAVQIGLVELGRVRWHRTLGWTGAFWATLVFVMGCTTTLNAAAREVHSHSRYAHIQVATSGLELIQMALFVGFVILAVQYRDRSGYHKRLMMLTIACMLPSVVARIPSDLITNAVILTAVDLFVVALVAIDSGRHRRLHPAFGWGGGVFLLVLNLAFPLMMSEQWIALGTRWVS